MRDLVFNLVFFLLLPFCVYRAYFGVLVYVWISLMNPHSLIYGQYEYMSYAMFVAVATMMGVLFNIKQVRIPKSIIFYLVMALFLYFTLTTIFALNEMRAWKKWEEMGKIYIMMILMCSLINDEEKFRYLLIVVAMSVGYYGFRGGIQTILTGGTEMVWGDSRSSLGDNNTLGMAELMVIPLMIALGKTAKRGWEKWIFYGTAALNMISVPASYSRGAVVGQVALVGILWLKSRRKILYAAMIMAAAVVLVMFLPAKWEDRMMTVFHYEEDASAMARVYGPEVGWNIAKERPLLGGGFGLARTAYYKDMAQEAGMVDIHNSFFQLLSEHGFVAFGIFLAILLISLVKMQRISRNPGQNENIRAYAEGLLVGLIPYFVSGSFMPRAYIEILYIYIGTIVVLCDIAIPAARAANGAIPIESSSTASPCA